MTYEINLLKTINGTFQTPVNLTSKVVNGFSIVNKLDESLDIGSMVIRGLTTYEPYGMFDVIQIKIDNVEFDTYRIAGDNVKLISKKPLLYEHTLSLVEHTKILELYQISGKTVTQPTDGSTLYTLYDVIDILNDTTPQELASNVSSTRIFSLPTSGTVYNLITGTDSPEFTFKDTTLREALNQVASVLNGIVRLTYNSTNGVLTFTIDLVNELNDVISTFNDLVDFNVSQDISLYATKLESEALNVISDKDVAEAVEIYPSDDGWITPRCDDYVFDFTKSYVPTPKPIYRIDKLLCYALCEIGTTGDGYLYGTANGTPALVEIDLSPYVVEWNKYKTLTSIYSTYEQAKNNTIFYQYRKPNVQLGATYGLFDTSANIENVIEFAVYDKLIADGYITDAQLGTVVFVLASDYTNAELMFRIYYTPIPQSTRFNIDREDLSDVDKDSTMLSNQQSRTINLQNFTNNMYNRINRIGNNEMQLDDRKTDIDDLYGLGDYTSDGFIVTSREIIFNVNYMYAKYSLSRNYNMISKFIGINSEIRQWEMGEQNTLDRNLIYKEYVEVNALESGTGSVDSDVLTTTGYETFLDTLYTSSTKKQITGGMISSADFTDEVFVPVSSNGGGNSLIFNFKMPNNKSAGSYLETVGAQIALNFAPYTDEAGQLTQFNLYLFDELSTGATTEAQELALAFDYPKTDVTYISNKLVETSSSFYVLKDNREILGLTLQLQTISKDIDKIGFGKVFFTRNRLVTESPVTALKLYTYTNGFKFGRLDNKTAPSGYATTSTPTFTVDRTNQRYIVASVNLTGADSYCITDENDEILFWVNQDTGEVLDTITFDFLNKRSGVNYKY